LLSCQHFLLNNFSKFSLALVAITVVHVLASAKDITHLCVTSCNLFLCVSHHLLSSYYLCVWRTLCPPLCVSLPLHLFDVSPKSLKPLTPLSKPCLDFVILSVHLDSSHFVYLSLFCLPYKYIVLLLFCFVKTFFIFFYHLVKAYPLMGLTALNHCAGMGLASITLIALTSLMFFLVVLVFFFILSTSLFL